ncbi:MULTISPECIES: hypothetical protein [Haloarcula]|uniref:hypothetical protein n=1 Tax=Haloarcula TaxID=2237 RepID=UPI0023EBB73D|nr:hypothetical protein [Halomicroarcula sp. XH51]
MSRVADNRHLLLFAGVVLTTAGAVGLGLVGAAATLSTLLTGGPILAPVALAVLGPLVLFGLSLVLAVALALELRRRASLPTHQGVADAVRLLERLLPPLSALGLADRFEPPEPTREERRAELVRRYVDGDLSEAGLERELESLLESEPGEEAPSTPAASAERTGREHETLTERDRG